MVRPAGYALPEDLHRNQQATTKMEAKVDAMATELAKIRMSLAAVASAVKDLPTLMAAVLERSLGRSLHIEDESVNQETEEQSGEKTPDRSREKMGEKRSYHLQYEALSEFHQSVKKVVPPGFDGRGLARGILRAEGYFWVDLTRRGVYEQLLELRQRRMAETERAVVAIQICDMETESEPTILKEKRPVPEAKTLIVNLSTPAKQAEEEAGTTRPPAKPPNLSGSALELTKWEEGEICSFRSSGRAAGQPPPPLARLPELWRDRGFLAPLVLASCEGKRRGNRERTGEDLKWIYTTNGSSPNLKLVEVGLANDWAQMTKMAPWHNHEGKQESHLILQKKALSSLICNPAECRLRRSICNFLQDLDFFNLSVSLQSSGIEGIKLCVSSYGADQCNDADLVEKEHKSSFFNWFYFSINIGALIVSSLLVRIQDNVGWGWGFGNPAVAMVVAEVSFFSGTSLYRNQKPGGSPPTRICQVVVASMRKHGFQSPENAKYNEFGAEGRSRDKLFGLVTSRDEIPELLKLDEVIDLGAPRGSNKLVPQIKESTKVPVLGHADGICSVYVDKSANNNMAKQTVRDAETDYPAAGNAMETLLGHKGLSCIGGLNELTLELHREGVQLFGRTKASALLKISETSTFHLEDSSIACTVVIAEGVSAAIDHINNHGSAHTECMVTKDSELAETFIRQADSAAAFHNTSTRFGVGRVLGNTSSQDLRIITNLHCLVPNICEAQERNLFVLRILEYLQMDLSNLLPGFSFASDVPKAATVSKNLRPLLSYAESLITNFLNEEDVHLLRVLLGESQSLFTSPGIGRNEVQDNELEELSWDKFSQLVNKHYQEAHSVVRCSSLIQKEPSVLGKKGGKLKERMSETSLCPSTGQFDEATWEDNITIKSQFPSFNLEDKVDLSAGGIVRPWDFQAGPNVTKEPLIHHSTKEYG